MNDYNRDSFMEEAVWSDSLFNIFDSMDGIAFCREVKADSTASMRSSSARPGRAQTDPQTASSAKRSNPGASSVSGLLGGNPS